MAGLPLSRPSLESTMSSLSNDSSLSNTSISSRMQFTPASSLAPSPAPQLSPTYEHKLSHSADSFPPFSSVDLSQDPNARTFPTHILALLLMLETDPNQILKLGTPSLIPNVPFTPLPAGRPVESDALASCIYRLAERLILCNGTSKGLNGLDSKVSDLVNTRALPLTPSSSHDEPTHENLKSINDGQVQQVIQNVTPPLSPLAFHTSPPGQQSNGALTAEEELRQLKAQVQDFARVCKVSLFHVFNLRAVLSEE